ncbi:unnamed protein product (macronuclear) [Paramecium tetraurelia]|uniref:Uncharacterized protein n=1 Tax=Paramecium tetraurelia TaxID=5888 RepID=A0BU34_PARTE|nr:uncharacterized protein GSPATT00032283001 [Paramecium tetraurelia]CAK62051.1 unnamed protein product [Paramecium tetraurelia]|eukprot:XP_001429449.1 hypothetical protein (macronuclear) [Paramecium tetraurelia strain d4-2]
MRIQASSFRLPALKLQPKDSQFSLSYGDYNQSSSSMIKYQSSPQRYYGPSPIKKRVRGMTIAIYNSQEKLKTAEFRYGSDLITQTQPANQSSSVINTVSKYRSKLKQLMYQLPKEDGSLSRDPRIYSFKEPAASIRLDRVTNDRDDQQLKDKITQLMIKVKLLLSSQQFYQETNQQETFQVTMVCLKDEYDCLYQDFNDYYVQNKKLDNQVLYLYNHMEAIKTLLKPKKPVMARKESAILFDQIQQEDQIPETTEKIEETPQQSQVIEVPPLQPHETPKIAQEQSPKESVFTPLTSIQLNEDQPPSDLEKEETNNNSPSSPKRKRIKNKRNPQKSQKSIILQPSVRDLSQLELNPISSLQQQLSSRSKTLLEEIPLKSVRSTKSEQLPEMEKPEVTPEFEKTPLKRQISNSGSLNKKRNTILENKQGGRSQKGATAISEQDDSQSDEGEDENQQEEKVVEIKEEETHEENYTINDDYNNLLDKLIESENIYRYPFYQTWEYHIDQIIQGTIFGEFDL